MADFYLFHTSQIKSRFLRKTFDLHIDTTKCTHIHFFRIFKYYENTFPNRVQMHPCSPLHFPEPPSLLGKMSLIKSRISRKPSPPLAFGRITLSHGFMPFSFYRSQYPIIILMHHAESRSGSRASVLLLVKKIENHIYEFQKI